MSEIYHNPHAAYKALDTRPHTAYSRNWMEVTMLSDKVTKVALSESVLLKVGHP
jgi:hypothetical protein